MLSLERKLRSGLVSQLEGQKEELKKKKKRGEEKQPGRISFAAGV